jgi:hypothetical protein
MVDPKAEEGEKSVKKCIRNNFLKDLVLVNPVLVILTPEVNSGLNVPRETLVCFLNIFCWTQFLDISILSNEKQKKYCSSG